METKTDETVRGPVFKNEEAFIDEKAQGAVAFTKILKSSAELFWPELLI